MSGFVKLLRTQTTAELVMDGPAFMLLTQIALRARREAGYIMQNGVTTYLEAGQALVGDYRKIGLTEQQYRSAKQRLSLRKLATFRATSKGTIAALANIEVYDINAGETTDKPTDKQRTNNGQATTNKKDTRKRRNIPVVCPGPETLWNRSVLVSTDGTDAEYLARVDWWYGRAKADPEWRVDIKALYGPEKDYAAAFQKMRSWLLRRPENRRTDLNKTFRVFCEEKP